MQAGEAPSAMADAALASDGISQSRRGRVRLFQLAVRFLGNIRIVSKVHRRDCRG